MIYYETNICTEKKENNGFMIKNRTCS